MKNSDTWSKDYEDVVNRLNNKIVLDPMWSNINKIEPEVVSLRLKPILDKDNMFFDEFDHINKKINSEGHRGPEFINNVDILFSGCSHTFGVGVEDGEIWGEIVANNLGLTYNNLSFRAGSTMQCILNIFNYCKKYGNPKYILCAFPPLTRTFAFVDSEFLTSKPYDHLLRQRYGDDLGPFRSIEVSKKDTYLKMPSRVEQVFSNEHKVWVNLMFISMLETYCNSNNIKLLWTNWVDVYNNKNKLMNTEFNNYFTINDNWDQTIPLKETDLSKYQQCHQDMVNSHSLSFNRGTDWEYQQDTHYLAHWGAHTHIHVAENFIEEIKKRGL
jgi:hypothetical protein